MSKILLFFIIFLSQIFSRSSLPLYLSLGEEDYNETKLGISEFISGQLMSFSEIDPSFNPSDYLPLAEYFKYPPTFHITMLYIGGNKSKTQTPYYQKFIEGQKFDIKLDGIVFVPGKIITGITFPDREKLLIENKYPHVTLMMDEWNAVDSNNLLESLFDGPISELYQKEFWNNEDVFGKKIHADVIIRGRKQSIEAFIIKNQWKYSFKAITKKNYNGK